MGKRGLVIGVVLLVLAGLVAWQIPAILKAIPSRYVARLPEPLQQLGVREHVDVLPTAAVNANVDTALAALGPAGTAPPTMAPATPTPLPTNGAADTPAGSSPTPPTPTLIPINTPIPIPATARLDGVRHQFQTWNNCGPATLAMALSYFDLTLSQNQTAAVLKPNPEDRNVSPHEMAAYVNEETEYRAIDRVNGDLHLLRRLLAEGFPVIVEVGIDPPGEFAWMGWYGHYLLVVAYEDASETFWVYDSWFGTSEVPLENASSEGREIGYDDMDRTWRQFNRSYVALSRPGDVSTLTAIIGQDMDDGTMWQHALERAQTELRAERDNAFLWFNLGTVYNALGDYEQAAALFDQARSIGLPWRMLWYQFGPYEAYYETGRYRDVILLADVTLQDRPYFEESYYYKGLAQAALGKEEEARATLEKAAAFNPNFAPAANALQDLGVAGN